MRTLNFTCKNPDCGASVTITTADAVTYCPYCQDEIVLFTPEITEDEKTATKKVAQKKKK